MNDLTLGQYALALWRTVFCKLLKLQPSLLSLAFNYCFYTLRLNYYILTNIKVVLYCFMMFISHLFLYYPILHILNEQYGIEQISNRKHRILENWKKITFFQYYTCILTTATELYTHNTFLMLIKIFYLDIL